MPPTSVQPTQAGSSHSRGHSVKTPRSRKVCSLTTTKLRNQKQEDTVEIYHQHVERNKALADSQRMEEETMILSEPKGSENVTQRHS